MTRRRIIVVFSSLLVVILGSLLGLVNSPHVKASSVWGIDTELIEMIKQYAPDYYHDFWGLSLSEYEAWIALITLRESGFGRYAAHSQWGGGFNGDKFYHKDAGASFPFSTGIGAFQLDRGGGQGDANENWTLMPTIEKMTPSLSLLSTLRWHRDRYFDPDLWTGVTLAQFSSLSPWLAVGPDKESEFLDNWESMTGFNWDDCKSSKIDVGVNPPEVIDPFENTAQKIGQVRWYAEGFDGVYDTWLITARDWSGNIVTQYYYTYREDTGWEIWVWNDPGEKLIYGYQRNYLNGQYPEGRIDTGEDVSRAGFTTATALLSLSNSHTVDVFMLVDLSGSFSDDLPVFKTQAPEIMANLQASYPDIRFGIGKFEDYPIFPFGDSGFGDKAYERLVDLTSDTNIVLDTIAGLYTRSGMDLPQSQLVALYQAASGAGQDLSSMGYPEASIPQGQQANFQDGATKIIILWTDADFHHPGDSGDIPYPGPSFTETIEAIQALDPPIVIGISSGGGGVADLQAVAAATGALAPPEGVDFNNDGIIDILAGEPLVGTISFSGQGIAEAIISLVNVATQLPIADAGGPYFGNVGQTITFDGSSSFDPDGVITTYEWDFEGDDIYDFNSANPMATHVYPAKFSGAVTLRVTDNSGSTGTDTAPVTIMSTNNPPAADAGLDQTIEQSSYTGAEVALNGSSSYDPDGDPLTYEWTWSGGSAVGQNPIAIFPLGTATVTLTVYDGELSDIDTVDIKVVDTTAPEVVIYSPQNSAEYTNTQGTISIQYTATDICDPDLDIVLSLDGNPFTGDEINPQDLSISKHALILSATDDSGNIGTAATTFTITSQAQSFQAFVIKTMTINWAHDVIKGHKTSDRFTIWGRLKLPQGFDISMLEKQATVSIEISTATGTDTVVLKNYPLGRLGNMWKYKGSEQPSGEDLNITSLNVWWAPQNGKWAGWAGFSISGVLQLPDGIGINTRPAEATVTIEIPNTIAAGGGSLEGETQVTFKVNQKLNLWTYTPRFKLPGFPCDPTD